MRSAWCLILPLMLGCSGENVVAGKEKTKQEQLTESLAAWCPKVCEHISACGQGRSCDCSGDACSCPDTDVPECIESCQQALRRYTLGGEACAALGQRFQGCVDGLSCDDFFATAASPCEPTASEQTVCPREDDEPPGAVGGSTSSAGGPTTSTTGGTLVGGTSSSGGSGGLTTGGTGTAERVVSCADSYGAGGSGGGPMACDEGRLGCSDGHEYSWLCARGANLLLVCSCLVDAQLVGGFAPKSGFCPSVEEVNANCGFALQQ